VTGVQTCAFRSATVLAVLRVEDGKICPAAWLDVEATPHASAVARQIADDAAGKFHCGTDAARIIGKNSSRTQSHVPDENFSAEIPADARGAALSSAQTDPSGLRGRVEEIPTGECKIMPKPWTWNCEGCGLARCGSRSRPKKSPPHNTRACGLDAMVGGRRAGADLVGLRRR